MKRRNAFALARRLHVLQVLLAVLLTVAINVAAVALSQRYPLRLDLTANGRYELSEENREFLAALDKQIHFYVLADQEEYARASTYTTYAATLLAQYPLYADVEVTYVDFAADPTFASRYPDLELAQNGIVVECEDRAVALETSDLFEYSYSAQNEIQVSAVGEARLASAIASVLNPVRAHATVLVDNDAQPVEAFCRSPERQRLCGEPGLARAGQHRRRMRHADSGRAHERLYPGTGSGAGGMAGQRRAVRPHAVLRRRRFPAGASQPGGLFARMGRERGRRRRV